MSRNTLFGRSVVVLLCLASPVGAQIMSRPTERPLVTAVNERWYQLGEPIQFAGDMYYRAGAVVYFDGNTMVRSGYYNGVPLYTDTTREPYSMVLVPLRAGQMQPYERLRRGDLAGTTGSRTPSFPVRMIPDGSSFPVAAASPTEFPRPIGALAASEVSAPERPVAVLAADGPQPAAAPSPPSQPMVSIVKPESNEGVWIHYQGMKWVSAGAAVPLRAAEFRAIGQYEGFPVFVRRDDDRTIYLPTRGGLVAPYKAR